MAATPSATRCSCQAQPSAEGFSGQTGLKRPFLSHPSLLLNVAQQLSGIEGAKLHIRTAPRPGLALASPVQVPGTRQSEQCPFSLPMLPLLQQERGRERPDPCLHLDKGT